MIVNSSSISLRPQRLRRASYLPRGTDSQGSRFGAISIIAVVLTILVLQWGFAVLSYLPRGGHNELGKRSQSSSSTSSHFAPMGKIAYGSRGGGEQSAEFIRDAVLTGFRHLVTSSHHTSHNETGVGVGWKMAVQQDPSIQRSDLFLQTMFVPWDGNDFQKQPTDPSDTPSIADQVKITIEQSLQNLQTTYIDAVLYHNFRAKLHPYEDMMQAWRVLEDYVERGIILHLGLSSCHDIEYFKRLHNESKVKPTIVQNRFHANRDFDVALRPMFQLYQVHVQRFWVLTGNGGGVKRNSEMAKRKGLTPEQLMFAFVMSLGDTPLVGTHNLQHMKDDIEIAKKDDSVFVDDSELNEYASNLGMKQHS